MTRELTAMAIVTTYSVVRVRSDQRWEIRSAQPSSTNGDKIQPTKPTSRRRGMLRPARSIRASEPRAPLTTAIRAATRRLIDCKCSLEMEPGAAPEAPEGLPRGLEDAPVEGPDDDAGTEKEHALAGNGQAVEPASAPGAELRELLRLELHVARLVTQNLLAQAIQDDGTGRLTQRGVVDLGDDLGGDQHGDGHFQCAEQVPEQSEHPIRARALGEGNAVDAEEPSQVASVALLLGDEESQRRDVVAVARLGRVPLRVTHEMAAFGAFTPLEFTDRLLDRAAFPCRQFGTHMPRNVEEGVAVLLEVAEPIGGRLHQGPRCAL